MRSRALDELGELAGGHGAGIDACGDDRVRDHVGGGERVGAGGHGRLHKPSSPPVTSTSARSWSSVSPTRRIRSAGSSGQLGAEPRDQLGRTARPAAGRARGSSGSRSPPPSCAAASACRCRRRSRRSPASPRRPPPRRRSGAPTSASMPRAMNAERVHVLDLAARAELVRARRAGRRRWRRRAACPSPSPRPRCRSRRSSGGAAAGSASPPRRSGCRAR